MSVAELTPRGGEFERTPPHDLAAEQCVLGGMLMSKDAISDVMEVISPLDHYRPAHQLVHEAILELYGRGEPADPVTVSDLLAKRGELARVGGGAYLHTLLASVPTAANAGYYARIVRERAILRRLVEAGTRIVQLGYTGDGDADELVDRAEAEIYGVTERRVSEDYLPLADIMPGALDEIEAIGSRGGVMTGVPTGFGDLDSLTNGLHPGQMIVIAARPAIGKALALGTPLPTPAGWTTMGEVAAGERLLGGDGRPVTVVAETEVMHGRPCYEVEFSDGEIIVADAQHQWLTWPPEPGPGAGALAPRLVTTEQIARTLRCPTAGHRPNHAVRGPGPLSPLAAAHAIAGRASAAGAPGGGLEPAVGAVTHIQRPGPDQPLAAARCRYIVDVRRVPSVPVRCVQVDSPDQMYLAGRSMIPTHNSTLALDLARAASLKHGLATVMFSLEMSRNEITMRLLSAESRVPLHAMRTGQMGEDDWTRLARRMSEVVDAPLFIDDSPNMSLMEIRAKCRRLKQRHNLRLVIVDYLQLMSSPRRVENRQQEVSEMSRSLKLLAKELDVPVVAISQLNRGPEQRNDKRPLLSDLRESGCLTAETRILRADTGGESTLGELLASGARDIPVWSLDERLRLVPRTMTHVFPSGVREVFRVRFSSGREVHATGNHPFLTYNGWKPLDELTIRSRVGVARYVPAPLAQRELPEPEIILLAHLIGDGSFLRNRQIRYASTDEANLAAVIAAAKHSEKFVPADIFSLPQQQLGLFLRHLWSADGSVTVSKLGAVRVCYGTTSERLARDLQTLLTRFGIRARLRAAGNSYGHPRWTLDVCGVDEQRRFLDQIGIHGTRRLAADLALRRLGMMTAAGRFDTVPPEVWERVRQVMAERHVPKAPMHSRPGTASRGDFDPGISPTRTRLRRVADILDDAELQMLATNDVFWDRIVAIESTGEHPVYDATVPGTHNFIANGANVHNSIEQDSDVVILLHREDAYERESPRAGEADLIVAKHRNGPTATVTVAFQGHYSRFVDMAPG